MPKTWSPRPSNVPTTHASSTKLNDAKRPNSYWATSDPDWSIKLAETEMSVDAGASVDIPVVISVLPDAAVDAAVRLTVRARDAAGGQVTGRIDMAGTPQRGASNLWRASVHRNIGGRRAAVRQGTATPRPYW